MFKGLMLYREIIAVCSHIHAKLLNTTRGQNVEFLNVKPGGTYSNQWALQGLKACSSGIHLWFCMFKYYETLHSVFRPAFTDVSENRNVLEYIAVREE